MPRPSLRCLLVLGAALSLAACDSVTGPEAVTGTEIDARPTGSAPATAGVPDDAIPGQYIVVLSAEPAAEDRAAGRALLEVTAALSRSAGAEVRHVYEHALTGFAAQLTEAQATALARDPRVQYVEPDRPVHLVSTTQTNATWGLDRIDQRDLPLSGTYTYATTASNVHAYILDTGIRASHVEFGGRVQGACFDAFGGNCNDGNGHGTHVAGTVGGAVYGVAKGVRLYAIRVLDNRGSGTMSGVIAGVDWVTANHQKPAVANMSLGGGASTALDDAIRTSVAAGVTYAVAAGNDNRNACNYSPARVGEALTVGSTTSTDARSSFSNFGTCVDLFAPGSSITAAWHTSNTAINTISGTSMASPHVAGAAALYLAANPGASPSAVGAAITGNATTGKVGNAGTGSPNRLLFVNGGAASPPPPPPPPPSGFTLSGTGTKVQGRWRADLSWTGSAASQITVVRENSNVATVGNSGSYTDQTNFRGGGSLTYRVCEAGTQTCSNSVTIDF